MDIRENILSNYSIWSVVSAARSGCPIKSRTELISLFHFKGLFSASKYGWDDREDFNLWHENRVIEINSKNKTLTIGWITKLLNVYLKTLIYIGGFGHEKNKEFIHPPVDNILISEIIKITNINNSKKHIADI